MSEFLDIEKLQDESEQKKLHIERYEWASNRIKGNGIANAACGTNYGARIMERAGRTIIGFDKNSKALSVARTFPQEVRDCDIEKERFIGFDVLVSLETIEHLKEPWAFLDRLSKDVKELVISVPIVPTKHFNEWHLHDFTEAEVLEKIKALGWTIVEMAYQNEDALPKPSYLLVYAIRP